MPSSSVKGFKESMGSYDWFPLEKIRSFFLSLRFEAGSIRKVITDVHRCINGIYYAYT